MKELKMDSTKYLLDKYGHAEMKGFMYVVWMLENISLPFKITKTYVELANIFNTTPIAIERNLRTYKNKVGCIDITSKEFISMLIINFHRELAYENS